MITYLIAYDLHNPRLNLDQLIGALQHKGAKRILFSTWSFQTPSSAVQVRNWIMQFLDEKDRVVVVAIGERASHNPICEIGQQ